MGTPGKHGPQGAQPSGEHVVFKVVKFVFAEGEKRKGELAIETSSVPVLTRNAMQHKYFVQMYLRY